MLEVLDNLPHDRVYFNQKTNSAQETVVELNSEDKVIQEIKRPISDSLIKESFELYREYS